MYNIKFDLPEVYLQQGNNQEYYNPYSEFWFGFPTTSTYTTPTPYLPPEQKAEYKNLPGFDVKSAERLADTAVENTTRVINERTNTFTRDTKPRNLSTGNCGRFVKRALLDTCLMEYQWVHACDMDTRFRNDPNFREIDLSKIDDPTKLPKGCILVYETDSGYSREHGHIAITLGDGRVVSDFIEEHPRKTVGSAFYYVGPEVSTLELMA